MKRKALTLALIFISFNLFADTEISSLSKVAMLQTYTDYGGGDYILTLENPASICKGYWASKDSPGYNSSLSIVLSAYQAGKKIAVRAHVEDVYKWNGTASHFCKIYNIRLGQ